jgi:hypothetical protein
MFITIATLSTFPFRFCGFATILAIGAILFVTRFGDAKTLD